MEDDTPHYKMHTNIFLVLLYKLLLDIKTMKMFCKKIKKGHHRKFLIYFSFIKNSEHLKLLLNVRWYVFYWSQNIKLFFMTHFFLGVSSIFGLRYFILFHLFILFNLFFLIFLRAEHFRLRIKGLYTEIYDKAMVCVSGVICGKVDLHKYVGLLSGIQMTRGVVGESKFLSLFPRSFRSTHCQQQHLILGPVVTRISRITWITSFA